MGLVILCLGVYMHMFKVVVKLTTITFSVNK